MHVHEVLDDLIAEQQALDAAVAALPPEDWQRPTPSPGWTVADQIGHLTFFDTTAALAIEDPDRFVAHRAELVERFADPAAVDELTLGEFRTLEPPEQLTAWREARAALARAGRTLADDTRVEWYGPSMGSKSFLTARLMEVWAHGQDICDTIGASRPATDRLRHIAQLGVITRTWSYLVRSESPPEGDVRVDLTAPSGDHWRWGAEDADASIAGSAEQFCLVVTQRRHVDDTDLTVSGELARDWMAKAQAFAGGATDGPPAGGHSSGSGH